MARRSRMSMLKRQRELKKNEKAARKRAKKHGIHEEGFTEPRPTVFMSDLAGGESSSDDDPPENEGEGDAGRKSEEDSA
jgi:hypothetical protein